MHTFKFFILGMTLFLSSTFIGCTSSSSKQNADPVYAGDIQKWHEKRLDSLKSENGWLNLVGLFWLKEGVNTFGTHKANDLIFPENKAPDFLGSFTLKNGEVVVDIRPGNEVLFEDKAIQQMTMENDLQGKPTILSYRSLRWYVIKRGEKIGVRLRDVESFHISEFEGIETFPVDTTWRLTAQFIKYDPPKLISVPNVLGTINEEPSPGFLEFKIQETSHKLDVISTNSNGNLFIVFADETTGKETYGGGRFIYVAKPDSNGFARIDFNKAYNPPCVFTPYATCPLPPLQNKLPVKITAGEKTYKHPEYYN